MATVPNFDRLKREARRLALLPIGEDFLTELLHLPKDIYVDSVSLDFQRSAVVLRLTGSGLPEKYAREWLGGEIINDLAYYIQRDNETGKITWTLTD